MGYLEKPTNSTTSGKSILSHTIKGDYFAEYKLLDRSILARVHSANFGKYKMIISSRDYFFELKRYIKFLLSYEQRFLNRMKVLQFCRVDFRLGWLKANFPNALIVNLRRNPRDIYGSYIGVYERLTKEKYSALDSSLGKLFYLDDYMNILQNFCGYKINNTEYNNYEKIYIINQLSNLWADKFADIVISYESLVENPVDILSKIVAHIPNFTLNFAEEIIPPRKDRVNIWDNYHSEDWFEECEQKCDRILKQIL